MVWYGMVYEEIQ